MLIFWDNPVSWYEVADNNQGAVDANQRDQDVPPVRQISVVELKDLMASDTPYELVDVRLKLERSIAAIDGFRQLDQAYHDHLIACGRDTPIIFQCHHGIRSQQAAEYFRQQGFRQLYNVEGGIEAWSRLIDPTVRRY